MQTLRLSIPESQVKDDAAVARMQQAILEKMAAMPGVTSVALASTVTMSGQAWHDPLYAEDRAYAESEVPPIRMFKFVSPGYMRTMGGSLVAGRDFTWADVYGQRPVAMVSENLARELWGGPSQAIGKRIRPYAKGAWREVVGVVSDTRDDGVTRRRRPSPTGRSRWPPSPERRGPDLRAAQRRLHGPQQRTGSDGFVSELEQAVWSVNPNLPLASVRTLQEIYDRRWRGRRSRW